MEQNEEKIKQTMAKIYTQIAEKCGKDTAISNITYHKNFNFGETKLEENNVYVVKLEKTEVKEKIESYEIHNQNGECIASVNEQGKIQFAPEYVEMLKKDYKQYFETLELENATFEQPEQLKQQDISLENEELKKEVEKLEDAEKQQEGENLANGENQQEEEKQEQEVAAKKGIPINNVLRVRENSNFYKDHPEIERNLIFSRGNDGIVKAEYIDENGELQPSKYIQPSQTALRQETVSIGSDGKPVTKETPYQVMQTQNIAKRDEDVRDIRINIKFDVYGYMEIEVARQGKNGEWASHSIEFNGRDYNSDKINKATSIRTGKANPDVQTKTYNKAGYAEIPEDEIQFDQMYLIQHSNEIIEEFIKQGYQKSEAVEIFNYMIGEEALTEKEAKERVNSNINDKEEVVKEEELTNEQETEVEQEVEEERTPWGDAEARRR